MPTDLIRYDLLAQAALRGVVRTVLAEAAKKGLPGEHHFKITFSTVADGVRLSERMRAQYPQAMTIILQHQFWDLAVREDAFEVGLSFGGVPERLAIPFDAVLAFHDPVAQFGFQFDAIEAEAAADGDAAKSDKPSTPDATPGAPAARPAAEQKKPDAATAGPSERRSAKADTAGGGEVVSLDRFRKK